MRAGSERRRGGGAGLQPTHSSLELKRRKKQFLSQKRRPPSLLPTAAELGRGGWEPLRKILRGHTVAGRAVGPQGHNLLLLYARPAEPGEAKHTAEGGVAPAAHETGSLPPATGWGSKTRASWSQRGPPAPTLSIALSPTTIPEAQNRPSR